MMIGGGGPPPPEERSRTSPYVGLEPYSESDAPFFFGREREQRIITANLRSSRLTLLYGASGVGKSSVLMAGVIHGLETALLASKTGREGGPTPGAQGARPRARFAIAHFSAWRDPRPLERLMERIQASVAKAAGGEQVDAWDPSTPAVEMLAAWSARARRLLVVLDQFEEYFLYHSGEDGDGTFATELARIVNDPNLRVNFLIAIREDAWAKLDRFKGRIPHLFSNYLRVHHLDPAAARRTIEGPIEEYNRRLAPDEDRFSVEPALVQAVLHDVCAGDLSLAQGPDAAADRSASAVRGSTHQIATPFLQLVMERLWEETLAKGLRELRKDVLDEIGGSRRIVSSHLDQSLSELNHDERVIAAEAFRFLVTPARTKIAQRASDLAYWEGRPEAEVVPVLEALSSHEQGRILRPLPSPPGEEERLYEIFHDVLADAILDWRQRWEQEREREALARKLEEEKRSRLEEERERHRERRNRLVRGAAGALLVLVVALAVMTAAALHQRGLARSRALAASSVAQLSSDPELSILLAREAWERGETPEAEEALRRALGASRVRTVLRVGRPLKAAVLSPRGTFVAIATVDGLVTVRSARTGRVVPARVPRIGEVFELAFSPDERLLVAGGEKETVITPIGTGEEAIELDKGSGASSADFSPTSRYLASARGDDKTTIWDARTGRRLAGLEDYGPVQSVAFSPRSNRLLVTASFAEREARIWDWQSGRVRVLARRGQRRSPGGDDLTGNVLASFSPDGRRVATAIASKRAQVWDVRSGALVAELKKAAQTVAGFKWSSDSRRLVTYGAKTARVFDASTGRLVALLAGHADLVNLAAFSPDGALTITASDDGTARVWDVGTAATLTELRGHTGEVRSGAFTPDGRNALTSSADGTARIWDVSSGRALRGHDDWVLSAAYSPNGRRVVTSSADGTARIWRPSEGTSIRISGLPGGRVSSARFSRDGRRIALAADTTNASGRIVIVSATTGKPVASWGAIAGASSPELSPDGRQVVAAAEAVELRSADGRRQGSLKLPPGVEPVAVAYSPDGTRIAVAAFDGVARIFDARTRRELASFDGHEGTLTSASFSPEGKRVVTTGADNTARVWEAATGRPVAELRGHTALVRSAAFSPDGKRVVTASADNTTRVWDARSGEVLSVQKEHADSVNDVSFSPDGRSILSASDDHTAKIYPCQTCGSVDRLLALAARRVTRSLTADERREFLGQG